MIGILLIITLLSDKWNKVIHYIFFIIHSALQLTLSVWVNTKIKCCRKINNRLEGIIFLKNFLKSRLFFLLYAEFFITLQFCQVKNNLNIIFIFICLFLFPLIILFLFSFSVSLQALSASFQNFFNKLN